MGSGRPQDPGTAPKSPMFPFSGRNKNARHFWRKNGKPRLQKINFGFFHDFALSRDDLAAADKPKPAKPATAKCRHEKPQLGPRLQHHERQ